MKVGIIFFKYPLYRKGSYFQEFVDALCLKSEWVVLIASNHPKGDFARPKNLSIAWVYFLQLPFVGDLIFNFNIFFAGLFSRKFREVDVINVISARGVLAATLLGKILKKPVVCTVEIINDKKTSFSDNLFYQFQKFFFSFKFAKIICWSEYYSSILQSWGISEEKISVIPGGINTLRYSPEVDGSAIRGKFPEKILIVFAKPMYAYNRKTAELLLDAVAKLKDAPGVHVLLGDGEQRGIIEQKIRVLGLSSSVSFMPVVSITEIPKYIAASDIVVLPFTYAATTARSLLEAMALGKPIITTRVGEISKIIENEKEALLVEPDAENISRAIERLIVDKELATKLGENARKKIESEYSIDRIVERTILIYNEAARK